MTSKDIELVKEMLRMSITEYDIHDESIKSGCI